MNNATLPAWLIAALPSPHEAVARLPERVPEAGDICRVAAYQPEERRPQKAACSSCLTAIWRPIWLP